MSIDRSGAQRISRDLLYPNRLNPNVMDMQKIFKLEDDMEVEDYDSLKVSPMSTFYTPEVVEGLGLEDVILEAYVICDGYHRWYAAGRADLHELWCVVEHWTERDAMSHFWRRHYIKGDMDALKEATMFAAEIRMFGRSRKEVMEAYGVSLSYIKTRMSLLNVADAVIELFYSPDSILTVEHLREVASLPKTDQHKVAKMCEERNWSREDLRNEIRRIKEGRGTRRADAIVDAPKEMPSSRSTPGQKTLHPNIDELLLLWEEHTLRFIKEKGEASVLELIKEGVGRGRKAINTFLDCMEDVDVLDHRDVVGRGRTGIKKIYFLKEVEAEKLEEPKEPSEPISDEKIFKEYPAEPEVKPEPEPEAKPEPSPDEPESEAVEPSAPEPVRTRPPDRAPPPKVVLDRAMIEECMEVVFMRAVKEGFNLVGTKKVDGREPTQWLVDELNEELDSFVISLEMDEPQFDALAKIILRACQLRHRLMRTK